jgi:hypothetical protein
MNLDALKFRKTNLVWFIVLAIALSACSPLIGRWQREDASDIIYDFRGDGTLIGEIRGNVYVGSYRIVDDGILTITEDNLLGNSTTVAVAYSIDGDKLVMTIRGDTRSYARIP